MCSPPCTCFSSQVCQAHAHCSLAKSLPGSFNLVLSSIACLFSAGHGVSQRRRLHLLPQCKCCKESHPFVEVVKYCAGSAVGTNSQVKSRCRRLRGPIKACMCALTVRQAAVGGEDSSPIQQPQHCPACNLPSREHAQYEGFSSMVHSLHTRS